jgi:cobalamin biosynthesis Co2+ chelatase CbiK
MSSKIDNNQNIGQSTASTTTRQEAVTTSNNIQNSFTGNSNNTNSQSFTDSINRSLDQTKDNINRSIDESKNQIPQYNSIVNSYQEQSLQIAREISEEYIESQKVIINSLQSAWRPFNERFSTVINGWNSPETVAKVYSKFVSAIADNAVSSIRLANNIMFSNMDSLKSALQQTKDNTKNISKISIDAAKIFEQNSKEIAKATTDTQNVDTSSNNTQTTVSK